MKGTALTREEQEIFAQTALGWRYDENSEGSTSHWHHPIYSTFAAMKTSPMTFGRRISVFRRT
jgi:hypothetical protein